MKSQTSEYIINRIKAAFSHEGIDLTEEDIEWLNKIISGETTVKEVKEMTIKKHKKCE